MADDLHYHAEIRKDAATDVSRFIHVKKEEGRRKIKPSTQRIIVVFIGIRVLAYSTLEVNEVHPGGLGRGISVPHKVEICLLSSKINN
jgi:hypothetical protein